MCPPTQGPWGSQHINEQFEELLWEMFTKDAILQFKTKFSSQFMLMMKQFNESKHDYRGHPKGVDIPYDENRVESRSVAGHRSERKLNVFQGLKRLPALRAAQFFIDEGRGFVAATFL